MNWNPTGVAIIVLGLIIGYCFGDKMGVGIAACLLFLIQLIPDRRRRR